MTDRAAIFGFTAALLLGAYLGAFIKEARVMYECEKDGSVMIKGYFWKGEIKYSCMRTNKEQSHD